MKSAAVAVIILSLIHCNPGFATLLEPNCGIRAESPSYRTRIIGGRDAQIASHPWMAFLHYDSRIHCGGTLINRQFVLTAAHCLDGELRLKVRLGGISLASSGYPTCLLPAEDYNVDLGIRHKYFTRDVFLNDIALLRLAKFVEYNVHIRPICIVLHPERKLLLDNVISLTATGWGKTENGDVATVLQEATIQVKNRSLCSELYQVPVGPNQICAGDSETNTCGGDSGGPLGSVVNYYGTFRFVQYGLTSFGDRKCRAPSVYTDVITYGNWIKLVVNNFGTGSIF
ncbi:serine protease grass [Drosophila elegans]|uniref:serine protease grass n=1 Tax=Drosophila elegans TaxID=30023 RepID=UPI0007E6AC6B|nr:serine protease grass [Drosophila elegans]